jgi:NAD(P)-dependent dehydrogenase (short-subunit alcohol dehydrogenase family)
MNTLFSVRDHIIIITGAGGALAGTTARHLASQGAITVLLGRGLEKLEAVASSIRSATPDAITLPLSVDVLDRAALEAVRTRVLAEYGRIDALINGAGGNMPGATIAPEKSFFDLDPTAFREVIDLNLTGTVLPTMIFAEPMNAAGRGAIVNYSSVSAVRALTRVIGYSAAKSGVENFTRWLAVDLAKKTSGGIRVNAVMPGFFLGDQNRALLTNPDGSLTARGQTIIHQTPFGRFGQAEELNGAIQYLLSPASAFVTGTVLTIDGGFTAFSGV